jgi:hypothetical protein
MYLKCQEAPADRGRKRSEDEGKHSLGAGKDFADVMPALAEDGKQGVAGGAFHAAASQTAMCFM